MLMRFIIGRTSNDTKEAELATEINEHGGFLRLDLEVLSAIIWLLLSALSILLIIAAAFTITAASTAPALSHQALLICRSNTTVSPIRLLHFFSLLRLYMSHSTL